MNSVGTSPAAGGVSVAERAVRWHQVADRLGELASGEADSERAGRVAADAVTARRLGRALAQTHVYQATRQAEATHDDVDGWGL